jgi:FkbM family methyltransferase
MITILEHTIEETIIDKNGWILDLGCVNFLFSNEMKKFCNNIICVDPNPNIINIPEGLFYENVAVVIDENIDEIDYYIFNDIQGYSLLHMNNDFIQPINSMKIKTTTIKKIMKKYNIEKFELIKFDIEGSEYEILKNIDWGITKQISVEFHDFRNMNPNYPNNEEYYRGIFENNKHKYNFIRHEITDHPGFPFGMGRNYWDSLFVEK